MMMAQVPQTAGSANMREKTSSGLFSEETSAPGMFVTIDGPNGSGKSTLAAALAATLDGELKVHSTRQPSSSELGVLIRSGERKFTGRILACLVAADRHYQLATEIQPRLREGAVVVCDRYIDSSFVLQRLDGLPIQDIIAINRSILRPDLRIRLYLDEDLLRRRLAARPANPALRFEQAPDAAARELRLYQDADRLLTTQYGLPSVAFDSGLVTTAEMARKLASTVRSMLDINMSSESARHRPT